MANSMNNKFGGEHHHHTPFGADRGLFSSLPLGNNGLGPSGRLDSGFQQLPERKPFNPEVLSVRSGATSGHISRAEGAAKGPFHAVSGHERASGQRRPDHGPAAPTTQVDNIMRDPLYPVPAERDHHDLGKLQFAQGHMKGSNVGHLMGQGPAQMNYGGDPQPIYGAGSGVHVVGWGPTTRILPDNGGSLETNRSTAALKEHNVRCGPMEHNIRFAGGIHRADRGMRVGYQGADGPTGHHAAPYHIQAPANPRADDSASLQQHPQPQSTYPHFPPREIGHLMPAKNVRGTPAGLGGAPRNPPPLGAPLDEIEVAQPRQPPNSNPPTRTPNTQL
jgi:hypothetical protein